MMSCVFVAPSFSNSTFSTFWYLPKFHKSITSQLWTTLWTHQGARQKFGDTAWPASFGAACIRKSGKILHGGTACGPAPGVCDGDLVRSRTQKHRFLRGFYNGLMVNTKVIDYRLLQEYWKMKLHVKRLAFSKFQFKMVHVECMFYCFRKPGFVFQSVFFPLLFP